MGLGVTRHRLILAVRDGEHLHRYSPSCPCGWQGKSARLAFAEEQYARHRLICQADIAEGKRRGIRPRPLTPAERLPEALRRTSPDS